MRTYCSDFDGCGYQGFIEGEPDETDLICPECFSALLLYYRDQTPVFMKHDLRKEKEEEL